MATNRQLSRAHPLNKLLIPHTKFHLAINTHGREFFFGEDGPVNMTIPIKFENIFPFMAMHFENWRYDECTFPKILKNNNITDNPNDLPGFYYRDDGKKIWDIMEKFITSFVDIFYKDDSAVSNDYELQNWAKDIVDHGYRSKDKGFPSHIGTKSSLIEIILIFIWIVTVQHAVLNFYQYDYIGWVPNMPGSVSMATPGHDGKDWEFGKLDVETIVRALPDQHCTAVQILAVYGLSQYSTEDIMIGDYPDITLTQKEFFTIRQEYKDKLTALSKEIKERGIWNHLDPRRVPNSIAI